MVDVKAERAAFEAQARQSGKRQPDFCEATETYADPSLDDMWEGWLARAALELTPEHNGENLVRLRTITSLPVPSETVLRAAIAAKIDPVLIVGLKPGQSANDPLPSFYFAGSLAELGEAHMLLERAQDVLKYQFSARIPP